MSAPRRARERYASASLAIQLPVSLTRREEIDEASSDRLEAVIKKPGRTDGFVGVRG